MCKRFGLVLLLSVFALMGFQASALADEAAPVAVVENSTFDFGAVYEGVDVVHDFIIQNKGTADLEVTDVKTG